MEDHVIDCCSLINLYTGWGGLAELRDLRRTWHICEAVINEVEYTREYDHDGLPRLIPLDIGALTRSGLLLPAHPETAREIEDYVNFAGEVDDGEAQALAIARNRGYAFLSDDRRATQVARRPEVAVRTVSTANILEAWAKLNRKNEARLRQVVKRISVLARFNPRASSPDYEWWSRYLQR